MIYIMFIGAYNIHDYYTLFIGGDRYSFWDGMEQRLFPLLRCRRVMLNAQLV